MPASASTRRRSVRCSSSPAPSAASPSASRCGRSGRSTAPASPCSCSSPMCPACRSGCRACSTEGPTMTIEIRQVSHPEAVKGFDTAELRRHFLIETLFVAGEVKLTYSHLDRVIVGGAMPVGKPVALPTPKAVGTDAFLRRRELGIVNVGGPGKVSVGGQDYPLAKRDALYVGKEAGEVSFSSDDAGNPAKFYLLSTPAHAVH